MPSDLTQRLNELAEEERRIDERIRDAVERQDSARPALDPAVYGRDRRLPRGRTR